MIGDGGAARRIQVLYEHGSDGKPYGSAYLRLIRPLQHPSLIGRVQASFAAAYDGAAVDAVIVDRLWRPDVTVALVEDLADAVHRSRSRLVYALDDDLVRRDRPGDGEGNPGLVVETFLRRADGVIVTTEALRDLCSTYNARVEVIPHALDERLLVRPAKREPGNASPRRRKVIGYMGTYSHDNDLMMVWPAIEAVYARHPRAFEVQLVGVVGQDPTYERLRGAPAQVLRPRPAEVEYPLFMLWFTSRVRWDIGIAPLEDTSFNRYKSDIKFLDYGAAGIAGIYSSGFAYDQRVVHQHTGWLTESRPEAWEEAIETLLVNDELRNSLAGNALAYVHEQCTLATCAAYWPDALNRLLDGA